MIFQKAVSPWLAALRSHGLRSRLDQLAGEYSAPMDDREAAAWQLSCFNRLWSRIREQVPYWQAQPDLGAKFQSWREFTDKVGPMDRSTMQDFPGRLQRRDLKVVSHRCTGGSTGRPLRFPVCREELEVARLNLWFGRRLFGITPTDRLFMLWGHSHLLGSGLRAKPAGWWRQLTDSALGYRRWSAYELDRKSLRAAGEALLEFRPEYMLGYSVALDRFAEFNQDQTDRFSRIGMKGVIATAESFPRADSGDRLRRVLGCPVIMEYGAVETGPIAYGAYGQGYRLFWRDFFVESVPLPGWPDRYELLVTALFPRAIPLIRYRIGDLTDATAGPPGFPRRIERIVGRCNDYVRLSGGVVIHSEAFTHAVKTTPMLREFQVVQSADGRVRIDYRAERELETAERVRIARRLARIHPGLASTELRRRGALEQTVAGKTPAVIRAVRDVSVS